MDPSKKEQMKEIVNNMNSIHFYSGRTERRNFLIDFVPGTFKDLEEVKINI